MPGPAAPLWLNEPTRFGALRPAQARIGLGLLALLLLACLTALMTPGPPPVSTDPARRADDKADVILYESIVAGVRNRGDYYTVTATALRRGDYPLRPFVTFRLPTLAVIQASIPLMASIALLYALAAAVLIAWTIRLRPAFARAPPLAIALVLLIGGMAAFVQVELVNFHEVWAGLLIALSLALRRDDRWAHAVGFALMAMLIRETAALYVMTMAVLALVERRRREAASWAAALAVMVPVIAAHAWAVARVVQSSDPASPGWAGLLGFGFFVKTMSISTALAIAPAWASALLVGLALFGWSAWPGSLARRAIATFAAYGVLLSLFGRVDTFYWGLMIAPAFLVGLAFVPDGVKDLIVQARRHRRVVVTREVR
ncbi:MULTISPECIES: DUF2079 domain-containing protein [Sphingomonas]|uniref:DUF2079 domain-containing protein n=1 Tax=Sphingomonas TaxID=13687 RepID=UPI00083604E4|nr:DUF2079 domain-containing protein [Sphingomonas sp. CCH10-B3]